MSDNLQETIRESAKAPAKASGDAGSVEQHNLTDFDGSGSLAQLELYP